MAIDPNFFKEAADAVMAGLEGNEAYGFLELDDKSLMISHAFNQLIRMAPPIEESERNLLNSIRWNLMVLFEPDFRDSFFMQFLEPLLSFHFLDRLTLDHFYEELGGRNLGRLVSAELDFLAEKVGFLQQFFPVGYGNTFLSALYAAALMVDYDEIPLMMILYSSVHESRGRDASEGSKALDLLLAASLFDMVRLEWEIEDYGLTAEERR